MMQQRASNETKREKQEIYSFLKHTIHQRIIGLFTHLNNTINSIIGLEYFSRALH